MSAYNKDLINSVDRQSLKITAKQRGKQSKLLEDPDLIKVHVKALQGWSEIRVP